MLWYPFNTVFQAPDDADVQDNAVTLRIPFPGVPKEELSIQADPVTGTLTFTTKDKASKQWWVDREYYDLSKTDASYKDGLLTVTVPAIEKKQSTLAIEIK